MKSTHFLCFIILPVLVFYLRDIVNENIFNINYCTSI